MISQIRIRNFKAFRDQTMSLAPLTLLTGLNGSGKSSLLQSLLLLRQSHVSGALARKSVILNGSYVNLGTYQDALFENAPSDERISIGLTSSSNNGDHEDQFEFSATSIEARACEALISRPESDLSIFTERFRFLMAERIGPRVSHLISESGIAAFSH